MIRLSFLLLFMANNVNAVCLDIDTADGCRYSQGDEWCQDNANDAPYAYESVCDDVQAEVAISDLFSAFNVPLYKGALATELNFDSNPKAYDFRTRLIESAEQGANFAGHYRIVEIGCGTACQIRYMIDMRDGTVSNFNEGELDIEFRENSRLIISSNEYEPGDKADSIPLYLVWEKGLNRFNPYQTIPELKIAK